YIFLQQTSQQTPQPDADQASRTTANRTTFSDRRPRNPDITFGTGEFVQHLQRSPDIVELTFPNGIDWPLFLQSFQQLCQQHAKSELKIQAIEQKPDEPFTVYLAISANADRITIERDAKFNYYQQLQLQAQLYKERLKLTGESFLHYQKQLIRLRQQDANILHIIERLAQLQHRS
ncbi:MAG: hypothetical protein AAGF24_08260, partial [Cyanobacteria bacterium P01_H01_bin.121]